MSADNSNDLQARFFNRARKEPGPVTLYLTNGGGRLRHFLRWDFDSPAFELLVEHSFELLERLRTRDHPTVDEKARRVLGPHRAVAHGVGQIVKRLDHPVFGPDRADNFDDLHQWDRIEEVEPGHAFGVRAGGGDGRNAEGRRVRRQHAIFGYMLLDLCKDLLQVALDRSPKDPLSQVTNNSIGFVPVNGIPIGLSLGYVCRIAILHLTFPFD